MLPSLNTGTRKGVGRGEGKEKKKKKQLQNQHETPSANQNQLRRFLGALDYKSQSSGKGASMWETQVNIFDLESLFL